MPHVMLLGPGRDRVKGIRAILRQDGHRVSWIRTVEDWRLHERELRPEIVIAAVSTTEGLLDGARQPHGFPAPLLIVQQEEDLFNRPRLDERLVDRLSSPFMAEELLTRVDALIRVRRLVHREAGHDDSQETPTRETGLLGLAQRVASWLRGPATSERMPEHYQEVASRVAEWADRRDAFEPGHAERVASFSAMIAQALSLSEHETSALMRAALLHDIGKVALPVEVLHQRQPLEDTQLRLIRTHPARGAALLQALDPDEDVARAVLYHHECPDGSGYYGKEADAVPRTSQILAVAEAFDAMTMSRVREVMPRDRALDRLRSLRGERYDTECVDALVDAVSPPPTRILLRQ